MSGSNNSTEDVKFDNGKNRIVYNVTWYTCCLSNYMNV